VTEQTAIAAKRILLRRPFYQIDFTEMKLICAFLALSAVAAAENKPDRIEWFRDAGFGLFIHWTMDSQIGVVESHSMVGASRTYLDRYINDLPKTFNPHRFNARDWAVLAKLSGVKYVVFTSKHHSGFTMFHSATTDFGIRNTPFGRDIVSEIVKEFRAQGVAPGLYFSPDDFWWLYKNGKKIQRQIPEVQPRNNPGLMKHDQQQVRELMTKYGDIDVVFFDGEPHGLKELAWQLNPNTVASHAVKSRHPNNTCRASRWTNRGSPASPWAHSGNTSR
jgi:alpha-L-fucosidase